MLSAKLNIVSIVGGGYAGIVIDVVAVDRGSARGVCRVYGRTNFDGEKRAAQQARIAGQTRSARDPGRTLREAGPRGINTPDTRRQILRFSEI